MSTEVMPGWSAASSTWKPVAEATDCTVTWSRAAPMLYVMVKRVNAAFHLVARHLRGSLLPVITGRSSSWFSPEFTGRTTVPSWFVLPTAGATQYDDAWIAVELLHRIAPELPPSELEKLARPDRAISQPHQPGNASPLPRTPAASTEHINQKEFSVPATTPSHWSSYSDRSMSSASVRECMVRRRTARGKRVREIVCANVFALWLEVISPGHDELRTCLSL